MTGRLGFLGCREVIAMKDFVVKTMAFLRSREPRKPTQTIASHPSGGKISREEVMALMRSGRLSARQARHILSRQENQGPL